MQKKKFHDRQSHIFSKLEWPSVYFGFLKTFQSQDNNSICFAKGEPPVRKDTEFQYAAEILITKSELEDKNKLVFTLQQQVSLFTLSAVCLQLINHS